MTFYRTDLLITSLILALASSSVNAASAKSASEGAGTKITLKRASTDLPTSALSFGGPQASESVNLDSIKPPRSSELLKNETGDRADYEKILDRQISELFNLTQKFKTSQNRGELWLRLAELYVEKSTLIDSRKQDDFDRKLKLFNAGKLKEKPIFESPEARDYNRKAVQLYEWFLRDFPRDEKVSQALFFLGYNHFELGDVKKAVAYYDRLTKEYPSSPFVGEAQFALAEYHFENEQWMEAYKAYTPIIKNKNHRLHTFALYKGAWCLYRLGRYSDALKYLEFIIKSGKEDAGSELASKRKVNRSRLEAEATRDLITFYGAEGKPQQAVSYFKGVLGGEVSTYIEKLAYHYADRGDKESSRELFHAMIVANPTSPKSFEYQYQVVQNFFYTKNNPRFKEELYYWVKNFGPSSDWHKANKNNRELMDNAYKLRETTLRNWVLQQHQTAQNSRAPFSQAQANEGYVLYLQEFGDSAQIADMHFYYGELLFDMGRFDEAAVQYRWVIENAGKSRFADKASQNLILAVEKSLPSDQDIQKRVGTNVDPIPLDEKSEKFITAGKWFIERFPANEKVAEVKFRIGRLYYMHNQFEDASRYFKDIVKNHQGTKYAEYSANLLLDIFNLKKDYAGLEKAGSELLGISSIAQGKAGSDIRNVLEKANFKKAQDLEQEKKYAESAANFEAFAKQNPTSNLATSALFNAGVNFERAGANAKALTCYQGVLASKDPSADKLKPKVKRLAAKLNQDVGNFDEAAKLYLETAKENPTDPNSVNMIFNAAVIYEALGKNREAVNAYELYIKDSKKSADRTEAEYSIATIYRKLGNNQTALQKYADYVAGNPSKAEHLIESTYWLSELNRQRGSKKQAEEWKSKTFAIQRKFAPNKKGTGAVWAAKLRLNDMSDTLATLKSIRLPKDPKAQKKAADEMQSLIVTLKGELSDLVKYDSSEELVAGLSFFGSGSWHLASSILNAPVPAGLTPEELTQYKTGIAQLADKPTQSAKESFKKAVEKGQELEVYTEAYQIAYDMMAQLDSAHYYNNGEVGSETKFVDWMEATK